MLPCEPAGTRDLCFHSLAWILLVDLGLMSPQWLRFTTPAVFRSPCGNEGESQMSRGYRPTNFATKQNIFAPEKEERKINLLKDHLHDVALSFIISFALPEFVIFFVKSRICDRVLRLQDASDLVSAKNMSALDD